MTDDECVLKLLVNDDKLRAAVTKSLDELSTWLPSVKFLNDVSTASADRCDGGGFWITPETDRLTVATLFALRYLDDMYLPVGIDPKCSDAKALRKLIEIEGEVYRSLSSLADKIAKDAVETAKDDGLIPDESDFDEDMDEFTED